MSNLHDIVIGEATIKIISSKSGVLSMAPPNLTKPYWVCIEEGGNYITSFDSLEEALKFITEISLAHGQSKNI